MRWFSESEILHMWELGVTQQPLDRALTILAVASQAATTERLALLTVGQRDARLFAVREKNFGTWLRGYAECPACREKLEFGFELDALRVACDPETVAQEHQFQVGEYVLCFRLPTSVDLAALVSCTDAKAARKSLLERCITSIRRSNSAVEERAANLPEAIITALVTEMQACDPQADMQINLQCAACRHSWESPFDILTFLWAEIQAHAKRLLREVHALAWAYGWREADILTMPPARRRMYLEMVT